MRSKNIYLDYAAATPLDKRVFKAMQPYFAEHFYNPSAPYQPARDVRRAIEEARAVCARTLGIKPAEIIFTAGVTESINLAINGVLHSGGHIVTSSIEHRAVLETARSYEHSIVKVESDGKINSNNLTALIREDTRLISIGLVNNEIGVIQDIKHIAQLTKSIRENRLAAGNQTPLYLHTDATQAAGYLDLSVARLGVDLLTLGGNKIYGPKQVGILFKASHVELVPLIQGSGHEQNLRSGTENVAGIIGLAEALRIANKQRLNENKRIGELKQFFVKQLVQLHPETIIISNQKQAIPHIVMLAWPGMDGERLVFKLENKGILVNTGAACAAKKEDYSHVLKALGINSKIGTGSLRFSFGRDTSKTQLARAVKIIAEALKQEQSR